jgi:hypothetical protein
VRFHGPRPRAAGRFLLPYGRCLAVVNAALGANTVTWGFPVTVCLVAEACANFGRAFCARRECRWRPGTLRMCRAARAAASAAAASASSDDEAVSWEDVMERIAW